jgi:hypothetical protein
MLKIIAALGVGSALVLTPVFAFADESTTPPKADTVKTPGNGPDVATPMHHHHHHHHAPAKHHTSKHHSMSKKPAKK